MCGKISMIGKGTWSKSKLITISKSIERVSQWQLKLLFSYHISCLRKNKNEDKEICLKCVVKVPKVCSEKLQWLLGLLFLPENIFLDKYKIFVINWSILRGQLVKMHHLRYFL